MRVSFLFKHTFPIQDKLAELKRQLEQLQDGVLPEYSKRLRRLEASHKERVRVNAVIRELEEEMVQQDFVNEKKASAREYEEHKVSVGHECTTLYAIHSVAILCRELLYLSLAVWLILLLHPLLETRT